MKICSKCKSEKEIDEFPKNKRIKNGLDNKCKKCCNGINKKYRDENKASVKNARKVYYNNNIDKMRLEKIEYGKTHKAQKRIYDLFYRTSNKDKIKEYKKTWEFDRRDDPIFKIKRNLRRRVNHVLKDNYKSHSTFILIGCSPEEFKLHIEKQFETRMSWDNYGPKGWHIDHIVPCYKFDLSQELEQQKCFHYSNQRPLWAKDNLSRLRD